MLTNIKSNQFLLLFALAILFAAQVASAQRPQQTSDKEHKITDGRKALSFYVLSSKLDNGQSRLSTTKKAYPVSPVERLRPFLELGDPFLGNGPIRPGVKTPFGQMLQPSFLLYGSLRTALQTSQINHNTRSEWSNRFDLHGNFNLSGTERLLFSLRPLDSEAGNSTGYDFQSHEHEGWHEDFNMRITKLFFEGELGEILPGLDPNDSHIYDLGFSVGRQRMLLQDGMLVNDIIDMAGITRNSLVLPGVSNLRITGFYGWNHINRGNNDVTATGMVANNTHSADLFGLSAEADTVLNNTIALDMLYVRDPNFKSALYVGASSTQRFGRLNSTFRANASIPDHDASSIANKGVLLFSQLSTHMSGSDNLLYLNTFWSIGHFTSAARSPDQGNPVANMGILFGPVGIGHYGVPLGQAIDNTIGANLGYQLFMDGIDRQLILEVGARTGNKTNQDNGMIGFGARL